METVKLLIADGAEDFRLELEKTLADTYEIRSCSGGKDALSLLEGFRPDVLILDLMLPELDGISLLQTAAARQITPLVLATTRYLSDYLLEALNHLGVVYLMVKPCDVRATAARLRDMTQRLQPAPAPKPDHRAIVTRQLHSLGLSGKLNGYGYLMEAIPYFAGHPGLSITKELYPAVAALSGSKASQVERSVRSAIHTAWRHRDEHTWSTYFPPRQDGRIPRPTNAEFIARLAEALQTP